MAGNSRNDKRSLKERDHIQPSYLVELRQKITQGLEWLRLGKSFDGEAVFDRIEAEIHDVERCDSLKSRDED